MQMTNRVPDWLTPVAWTYIALSFGAALYIAADIYLRQRRQSTVASELVWITSALYLGPFAVALYRRHSKPSAYHQPAGTQPTETSSAVIAGLPGGGASAVAHLIGVPLVIASGLTIAGIDLWVMIIVIGILAMLLLLAYERAGRSAWRPTMSVGAAAAAAVLTVLAFDIGMGGWMLLLHFNEFMPPATDGSFWFLMQVGIVLGLITGYPVVRWLQRGVAEPRHAASY